MKTQLIDKLQLTGKGVISIIGAGGKTSLMFQLAKQLADSGKNVLTTTTTKIFMPKPLQSPSTIIKNSFRELVKKSNTCLMDYSHFSAGSRHDSASGKLCGFAPDIIDQLWQADIFDWIIVEADGARQKPLKATASYEPVVPGSTTHLILVTGLDAVGIPLNEGHVHRAELFSKNTGFILGNTLDEKSIATGIAIEIKKAWLLGHTRSNPGSNCGSNSGSKSNFASNSVFLNKADNPGKIKSGQKIAKLLQTNKIINRIITASLIDEFPIKSCLILK
ncbi:MAG: putative selenium-dependent hydroxylase accessory protein YqeC [Desulfobacula sp.]|nr:putative selenium-dependent hydroxylase accessory protein YqeC [Desulfobacula sp.]